jgi:hypothetical protein
MRPTAASLIDPFLPNSRDTNSLRHRLLSAVDHRSSHQPHVRTWPALALHHLRDRATLPEGTRTMVLSSSHGHIGLCRVRFRNRIKNGLIPFLNPSKILTYIADSRCKLGIELTVESLSIMLYLSPIKTPQ